jgi:hypothetical protein
MAAVSYAEGLAARGTGDCAKVVEEKRILRPKTVPACLIIMLLHLGVVDALTS